MTTQYTREFIRDVAHGLPLPEWFVDAEDYRRLLIAAGGITLAKQIAPADYDTPLDDMEQRFLPAVEGSKTTAWWNMEHEEWGPYAELMWVIVEYGDERIWIRPMDLTPEDRLQVQAAIDEALEDMG